MATRADEPGPDDAGQRSPQLAGVTDAQRRQVRARIRARLRECREYADSPEGQAAAAAWLARFRASGP
jgi:hypothetical protein